MADCSTWPRPYNLLTVSCWWTRPIHSMLQVDEDPSQCRLQRMNIHLFLNQVGIPVRKKAMSLTLNWTKSGPVVCNLGLSRVQRVQHSWDCNKTDRRRYSQWRHIDSQCQAAMIGTLRAGDARGLRKTPKHTHYTHKREPGCRHWGGTRHEGGCKGEAAGKRLGPRKVSLNVLHRVRTQPKPKNQLKQPLTLNTLSN